MDKLFGVLRKIGNRLVLRQRRSLASKLEDKIPQVVTASNVAKPELKNLSFETVIVMNGASGIGFSVAVKLAKLKANVGIWDKDEQKLNDTKKFAKSNLGLNLVPFVCDISNRDEVYKTAEKTKEQLGKVTTIIHTVTYASEQTFMETPDDLLENVFKANVFSQMWLTKAFLPGMMEANSGRLVTVSSMVGHMGVHKLTDFCATNAAAINFQTALKAELDREGCYGIKTLIVCPYFTTSYKLHKHIRLRLVRGVSREEVAERTIQAMLNDESLVFLPGWLKYPVAFRWLCPNFLSNFLKNLFIKDANTYTQKTVEVKTEDYMEIKKPLSVSSVPEVNSTTPPITTEPQEQTKVKEL